MASSSSSKADQEASPAKDFKEAIGSSPEEDGAVVLEMVDHQPPQQTTEGEGCILQEAQAALETDRPLMPANVNTC